MIRLNRRITRDGSNFPLKSIILMYLHSLDGVDNVESLLPTKEELAASTVVGKTWKLQTTSESLWITTADETLETYIALKFS